MINIANEAQGTAARKTHVQGVLEVFTSTRMLREFEQYSGMSHGHAAALLIGKGASEKEMGRVIQQLMDVGQQRLSLDLLLAHTRDHIPFGHEKLVSITLAQEPSSVAETSLLDQCDLIVSWVMSNVRTNPSVFGMLKSAMEISTGKPLPTPEEKKKKKKKR